MTTQDLYDQPLTLAQLDFWEEFSLHPDEAVSTVAHAIEFSGAVDAEALANAIVCTVAETDVLALRFRDTADGPRQSLDPRRRPELRRIDLGQTRAPRDHALALMQTDVTAPLDLLGAPLSAQWLITLGPGHMIWYNRGHHIVLDGYAMGMIEARVAQHYAALALGTPLGPPLGRFAEYLAEEASYRGSDRHEADGAHWSGVLARAPAPRILTKGSENYPAEGLEHAQSLSDLAAALMARSAEWRIGWPDLMTTLCAIWAAASLRDGSAQIAADHRKIQMPVWLPYLSRMGSVAMGVPALVVNILPFDVRLDLQENLASTVQRLAGQLRTMRRHGRYRIEQIAGDHGLGSQQRFFFSPLINVLPFDPAVFPGCESQRHILSNGPGDGFNITIRADGGGGGMDLLLGADPALTPPAAFAGHCAALPAFLRAALDLGADNLPIDTLIGHPVPV